MEKKEKGFTLAELLIVVAIIAVLVAIAILAFASHLERAKQATDLANIRSAYSEASVEALTSNGKDGAVETAIMKHTGPCTRLSDAQIGDLDLTKKPDAEQIIEGYSVLVTVSAIDGSVRIQVGNGGRVLGAEATQSELDSIKDHPYNYSSFDEYWVKGNKLTLYRNARAGSGGEVPKQEDVIAEYGKPQTLKRQFNAGYTIRYYKWDGARWYVVQNDGEKNTWQKATSEELS